MPKLLYIHEIPLGRRKDVRAKTAYDKTVRVYFNYEFHIVYVDYDDDGKLPDTLPYDVEIGDDTLIHTIEGHEEFTGVVLTREALRRCVDSWASNFSALLGIETRYSDADGLQWYEVTPRPFRIRAASLEDAAVLAEEMTRDAAYELTTHVSPLE